MRPHAMLSEFKDFTRHVPLHSGLDLVRKDAGVWQSGEVGYRWVKSKE